jgi:hypothetical protein
MVEASEMILDSFQGSVADTAAFMRSESWGLVDRI